MLKKVWSSSDISNTTMLKVWDNGSQCVDVQLWNLDFEANTGKQTTGIWNVLFEKDCRSNWQRHDQE